MRRECDGEFASFLNREEVLKRLDEENNWLLEAGDEASTDELKLRRDTLESEFHSRYESFYSQREAKRVALEKELEEESKHRVVGLDRANHARKPRTKT